MYYTSVVTLLFLYFLSHLFSFSARADETDLYDFLWLDPDKKVYVLQNKIHKKTHTFYGSLGYLKTTNSKFQDSKGLRVGAGYYLTEEWSVELLFNNYKNSNNKTYENVTRINGSEPFVRKINSTLGAVINWSPFYGKMNTFNKIFYFDWYIGAGVVKIDAESNINTVANANAQSTFTKEKYTGGLLKTGIRFYIDRKTFAGFEFQSTHYQARSPLTQAKSMRANSDIIFIIGISF